MDFNKENLYTTANADEAPLETYGYFANNLEAIRNAIEKERISLSVVYTRLEGVMQERFERRFSTDNGSFSLFYKIDLINAQRY